MLELELPTKTIDQKSEDPHDLIIVGVPKMGKTVITAELTKKVEGKALLLCLEQGGTDYLSGVYVNIWNDPNDPERILTFKEAIDNYKAWRTALLKNKGNYDYLIVDSMTKLYDIAEVLGTYFYMDNVPQGKNFNRVLENGRVVGRYEYGDTDFKLVTELGEGYGYKYVYKWFTDQMDIFAQIAKYRVYIAHVKDKLIKSEQNVEEIKGSEINLTGKLKNVIATRVASLCKMIADGEKRYLSFEVDNDNIIAGGRVPRLKGKILISELGKDGKIKTWWEEIFTNLKSK